MSDENMGGVGAVGGGDRGVAAGRPRDVRSVREDRDLEHVRWVAQYGGGDELADANCWRDTRDALRALLVVLDAAQALKDAADANPIPLTSATGIAWVDLEKALARFAP